MQKENSAGGFFKVPGEGRTGAARTLCADLLGKAGFKAVLVQKQLKDKKGSPPALITSSEASADADPFSAVMPVNAGGVAANMTRIEAFSTKTAILLRPCESRAFVELTKLKQARTDNLVVFGIDCPGTRLVKDHAANPPSDPAADLEARLAGKAEGLREACLNCVHPAAPHADVRVCLYGAGAGVALEPVSEQGRLAVEALGYQRVEMKDRATAVAKEAERRTKRRDESQKSFLPTVEGKDRILSFLSKCLNCHNCQNVCPVCYCRECFFDSPTFEIEADKFMGWATARGALRMPADLLLFHLTRLTHMAHSCIACGMCTQGCPSGIEVGMLFSSVGRRVQKVFEYEPGMDPDQEIPLATFREDELETFGGR